MCARDLHLRPFTYPFFHSQAAVQVQSSPALLYPYLRTYVSDTVTRAGFVPLHMGEVSFAPVVIERSSDERPSELAA